MKNVGRVGHFYLVDSFAYLSRFNIQKWRVKLPWKSSKKEYQRHAKIENELFDDNQELKKLIDLPAVSLFVCVLQWHFRKAPFKCCSRKYKQIQNAWRFEQAVSLNDRRIFWDSLCKWQSENKTNFKPTWRKSHKTSEDWI